MWVCNPVRVNKWQGRTIEQPKKERVPLCLVLISHLLPIQEAKKLYKVCTTNLS